MGNCCSDVSNEGTQAVGSAPYGVSDSGREAAANAAALVTGSAAYSSWVRGIAAPMHTLTVGQLQDFGQSSLPS
jgi:hypothetical protein